MRNFRRNPRPQVALQSALHGDQAVTTQSTGGWGRFFILNQVTHLTQVVSPLTESSWDNNFYCLRFGKTEKCHQMTTIFFSLNSGEHFTSSYFERKNYILHFSELPKLWLLSPLDTGLTFWLTWVTQNHRKNRPEFALATRPSSSCPSFVAFAHPP